MSENEAEAWVAERFPGSHATLARFVALVLAENRTQNLIAPSTESAIWSRHVVDSLQLVPLAGDRVGGTWLDIGTGGGFPGLAVAVAWTGPVVLAEPRRRRADFLRATAEALGLRHVLVEQRKVESVACSADVLSARAVASIPVLVRAARHAAAEGACWLLPRGRVSEEDEKTLRSSGLMFHVEQSLTSPDSSILVLKSGKGWP